MTTLPEPYYERDGITLYVGDNREVLPALDVTVSAVVTDPPYGLSFMGKDWDHSVPGEAFWRIIADAMKPGAHLLSFGGSRTFHRMGVAIEDAGLELRDTLMWLYGSGMPKSHDVSKAIESNLTTGKSNSRSLRATEQAGDGEMYTLRGKNNGIMGETRDFDRKRFTPATPQAQEWAGWGTALKPAHEPIILARKRLSGTVAANVLAHGTGALNIDASRIGTTGARNNGRKSSADYNGDMQKYGDYGATERVDYNMGRWPANVILDEESAMLLDAQSGVSVSRRSKRGDLADHRGDNYNAANGRRIAGSDYERGHDDTGGASRFFYVAKASRKERNAGLDGMPERMVHRAGHGNNEPDHGTKKFVTHMQNHHPTVKPLALMRYLVTLVTPPGGIVLDPFAGSGSTLVACAELGIPAIGIEMSEEYAEIAARRIDHAINERTRPEISHSLLLGV